MDTLAIISAILTLTAGIGTFMMLFGKTDGWKMTEGTINIDTRGISGKAVNATGKISVAATATLNTSWTQGMENAQSNEVHSTKEIRDGQVLIIRNGKTYNMNGIIIN